MIKKNACRCRLTITINANDRALESHVLKPETCNARLNRDPGPTRR